MLILILIAIVVIIMVIYNSTKSVNKKSNDSITSLDDAYEIAKYEVEKNKISSHSTHSDNTSTCNVLTKEHTKIEHKPKNEAIFFNEWNTDRITDFSYLTPSQAKYELKKRKEYGEFLDEEDYYGLIEVIASEKDEKYFDKIVSMTPEETSKWFNNNYDRGIKMSTLIWKVVARKVAPLHEEYLIEKMKHKTSKGIVSFVSCRKKEGYFFSEKAYQMANDIYYGMNDKKK